MKSIGVFCGSSFGENPVYREKAEAFGKLVGSRHLTLVYGGGTAGLMGTIAGSALASGSRVISVIPRFIRERVGLLEGSEEILTETMHERKNKILDLSDGLLAFPGGIGTMDEFFEAYTWSQLGLLKKPVALLNIEQFYNSLLLFMDCQVKEGFLKPVHRDNLIVSNDAGMLLDKMEAFRYTYTGKWKDHINFHQE